MRKRRVSVSPFELHSECAGQEKSFPPQDSHSKRSASVLVRRATGLLVLSLVMAYSCMPSSSATLAWVLLFTRELRNNWPKGIEMHLDTISCLAPLLLLVLGPARDHFTDGHQGKWPSTATPRQQRPTPRASSFASITYSAPGFYLTDI